MAKSTPQVSELPLSAHGHRKPATAIEKFDVCPGSISGPVTIDRRPGVYYHHQPLLTRGFGRCDDFSSPHRWPLVIAVWADGDCDVLQVFLRLWTGQSAVPCRRPAPQPAALVLWLVVGCAALAVCAAVRCWLQALLVRAFSPHSGCHRTTVRSGRC